MTRPVQNPLNFLHDLTYEALPEQVRHQALLNLLDLVGVAIGGSTTRASHILRDSAPLLFGGDLPMLFDGRATSPAGHALTTAATIDALDGHDGFNTAKGHAGCGVFAAAMAFAMDIGNDDGKEFITTITVGYELACRLALALHGTTSDYHTSGAWVAVAAAGIGARTLKLDAPQTRHALGIAEYPGPRSQMMRCIDHPTMVNDGSGWGAMAGTSAAYLAQSGFTGAPALTLEQAPEYWRDLGNRWLIKEQYYKPYPVCRWAQAPIEAILELRRKHGLVAGDVAHIEVEPFHESVRLATNSPTDTDAAQYSTSFPCAVAMVRGQVAPQDITDDALQDPEILRLSRSLTMCESDHANAAFPATRLARVRLILRSGDVLTSGWTQPRWDPDAPPTEAELRAKFHAFAAPVIGEDKAREVEAAIDTLRTQGLAPLRALLTQPIKACTASSNPS